MTSAELARELKQRAGELGFAAAGVARAAGLERDGARLDAWLAAGRHAGMSWMARTSALRADPRRLLPGCRSVVSVAMSYHPPGPPQGAVPPGRARVALYARGRDYHRVLGRRLRELAGWLEQATGTAARAFTDTGPVLERAWAERAGLGWIGKNGNVIARDLGSWLLLGEVLSAADIEPDGDPHAEFCGSCTACIEACPTAAIVADGVVDAERCISYWTIEHRGPIPAEQHAGIGSWIFGCDVCQDVCPWNVRFGRAPAGEDPFAFTEDLRTLDPREILALDERAFRARFSGSALMRARWDGLRRNACVVLGNAGDERALPILATTLGDPDPMLRGHAAWAIGRIGAAAGRGPLAAALAVEPEPAVRGAIERSLAALEPGASA